ncbi:MAG TPA: family 16 glycosylhydrolase [Verrucomicrobiae bacterium]|nr:family 16 glycosylhydrolase [Verrucomicrobiae bacterium]
MKIKACALRGRLFAVGLGLVALTCAEAEPPAGRQWKMVFSDEFGGRALDESKWVRRGSGEGFCWNGAKGVRCDDHAEVDGKGNFVIRVTRDEDGTYRYHNGVNTKGKFQQTYGYFETRAKFTRQPGWWGAVWMYGVEVGPNPFLMGQEIDIFEDFNKPKKKNDFAHNLHLDAQLDYASEDNKRVGKLDGDALYRVSRGTNVVVESWDDFHVVGVEWTPLEYIFYCDGKETFRMDYRQVPVTTQPMHLLISGCYRDPNRAKFQGDYAEGQWPDQLTVDYVRAYEEDIGSRKRPSVALRMREPARVLPRGSAAAFDVSATDEDGSVDRVFVFDNGRIRGESAGGSASFTIPGDQIIYGDNIVIAMARDKDGLIGMSEPLTFSVRGQEECKGRPYGGKRQTIPGKIVPGHYDEGGQHVAYFTYLKGNTFAKPPWNLKFRPDEGINSPGEGGIGATHRGQWVSYSVDVGRGGDYAVAALVARPDAMRGTSARQDIIALEVDGEPIGQFAFSPEFTTGRSYWADYQTLPAQTVRLTSGPHVLRVRFDATPFNFGGLTFTALAEGER